MSAIADSGVALGRVRTLLIDERSSEAITLIDHLLESHNDQRFRADLLALRLTALINEGRRAEFASTMDAAFDAAKARPEPGRMGKLHALAALVAQRDASLDRCVTHLVQSSRALAAAELTDAAIAWAWHDLAMAYSYAGFHAHAQSTLDRARQIAATLGMRTSAFAAPQIRLRQAVWLDQRGDTDGCERILRGIARELETLRSTGELDALRPSSRVVYGYALARLGALGHPGPLGGAPGQVDPASLLAGGRGESVITNDLQVLGSVCMAIAKKRAIEAVARLETAQISESTLGAAEPHRLRALAHIASGDYKSALAADRHACWLAYTQSERLRDLFVDAVAARLDHEDLRRTVARQSPEPNTDQLTGLPNRPYLERYVADLLAREEAVSLGICDLDGFATVNAVHGQVSGDLVLQRIAGVLNRVMRRGDFVARYGGDEFMVVLPTTSHAEAQEIARRIVRAVAAEDWQSLVPGTPVGVRIGWAGVSGDGPFSSPQEAFKAADQAIVEVKGKRS
jgi:diguanylate cyclase (GGDEF)-like protein